MARLGRVFGIPSDVPQSSEPGMPADLLWLWERRGCLLSSWGAWSWPSWGHLLFWVSDLLWLVVKFGLGATSAKLIEVSLKPCIRITAYLHYLAASSYVLGLTGLSKQLVWAYPSLPCILAQYSLTWCWSHLCMCFILRHLLHYLGIYLHRVKKCSWIMNCNISLTSCWRAPSSTSSGRRLPSHTWKYLKIDLFTILHISLLEK